MAAVTPRQPGAQQALIRQEQAARAFGRASHPRPARVEGAPDGRGHGVAGAPTRYRGGKGTLSSTRRLRVEQAGSLLMISQRPVSQLCHAVLSGGPQRPPSLITTFAGCLVCVAVAKGAHRRFPTAARFPPAPCGHWQPRRVAVGDGGPLNWAEKRPDAHGRARSGRAPTCRRPPVSAQQAPPPVAQRNFNGGRKRGMFRYSQA